MFVCKCVVWPHALDIFESDSDPLCSYSLSPPSILPQPKLSGMEFVLILLLIKRDLLPCIFNVPKYKLDCTCIRCYFYCEGERSVKNAYKIIEIFCFCVQNIFWYSV